MNLDYKCPHCGKIFDGMKIATAKIPGMIPTHDYPPPCRSVCPGSGQHPRDPNDKRPLWKDER